MSRRRHKIGCIVYMIVVSLFGWVYLSLPPLAAGQTVTETQPAQQAETQPVDQAKSQVGPLESLQNALVDLVQRVGPTVVAIQADRRPRGIDPHANHTQSGWTSTGAGVIIREDGRILTSQHVIDGASDIHVILSDGRRLRARRIADDRRSDLAVIRINTDPLTAAQLAGDSVVRRGHIVLALGNPMGLSLDGQAAVSFGIVSAIGRPLPVTFGREEDRYYGDMIQISAAINPGNSGGPLIDSRGRVIGIIAAVNATTEGLGGIAFAIPINAHTKGIINKLLHGQQIEYGYMGVQVDQLSQADRQSAGLPPGRGILIDSVEPDGPAYRAGMKGGDFVVTVNGTTVRSVEQFVRMIGAAGPGRQVAIGFLRNKQRKRASLTLTRRPTNAIQPLPDILLSFRGADLAAVDPLMRRAANLPESALLVLGVQAGSAADAAGLTPGDIIVRLGGKPLTKAAISRLAADQHDLLFGLANGGSVLVKAK